jgi:hypothetical protein
VQKDTDKVFEEQTLESLTPGILGSSSPTKVEKNREIKINDVKKGKQPWIK